jgi:aerobic-type carbon monoxide dehydrogenase small subunit (CoxS/CutS family)
MDQHPRKAKKSVSRRVFLKQIGGGAAGVSVATRIFGSERAGALAADADIELSATREITLTINGKKTVLEAAADETLLGVLRERLGLTGAKRVCDRGECGGCTVVLNGRAVYACQMLALQADGAEILTVEGLASGEKLHPIQQAFIDHDGYQCGYCTPGFIIAAVALLAKNPQPSAEEIRTGMSGNLCRCGNYQKIQEAVAGAAEAIRRG